MKKTPKTAPEWREYSAKRRELIKQGKLVPRQYSKGLGFSELFRSALKHKNDMCTVTLPKDKTVKRAQQEAWSAASKLEIPIRCEHFLAVSPRTLEVLNVVIVTRT